MQTSIERASRYKIISEGLSYPLKNFGDSLKKLIELFPESGQDTLSISLRSAIEKLDLEEYEMEYNRLFETSAVVPPYEASYLSLSRDRRPLLIADISAFYIAFGLRLSQKNAERADHICVEAELMGFLCLKEAYASDAADKELSRIAEDAQKIFFCAHLGQWIEIFCNKISENTENRFLISLIHFIKDFVEYEKKHLEFQQSEALYHHMNEDTGPEDMVCPLSLEPPT